MNTRPEKNSDKTASKQDELRQQLWELAYGLLEPEVEAAVRAQIKSDPAIARLYSEVRLQTDLVGVAARVQDSAMHIVAGPDAKFTKVDARSRSKHPSRALPAVESRGWNTNWLAVGGTVALLVLLAFGLYQPQITRSSVAKAEYYFTKVIAPANTPAGVSQTVEVKTTGVDANGQPAEVALRVVNSEGIETFRKQLRTDENGLAAVKLPGSVVQRGARVEATPANEEMLQRQMHRASGVVSAPLIVVEEPRRTFVQLQSPRAKAGDTVGYTVLEIGEYSKQAKLPAADELAMDNRTSKAAAKPEWSKDEVAGVLYGEFEVPSDPSLDAKSYSFRRGSEPAQKRDPAGNAQRDFGYGANAEREKERQAAALGGRGGIQQANGAAPGGVAAGGAELRGSAMDAQRSLTPGEGAPKPPAPSGEGGVGGKFGSPQPGLTRNVAPANPTPANAPAPTPSPEVPMPLPAPLAPAPPGSPRPEAGASADLAATPSGGGIGKNGNRKNAANQLTENSAEGNARVTPAPAAADRHADRPGAVVKSLSDPAPAVVRGMQPRAPLAKDGRAQARATLPDEKPIAENRFYANDPQQQIADAQPQEAKAQAAILSDAKELRELQIPPELLGQSAVLVARRHGVLVFHRQIDALKESDQFVDLPPEVEGRVEVELYRPDGSPQPMYRQQIVRAASRALRLDVKGLQERYAPGEKVQLQIGVRDELGNPVAAAVGVRVWNDLAARETKGPLLLVDLLEVDALQREPEAAPIELAKAGFGGKAEVARNSPAIGKPAGPGVAGPAAAAQGAAVPALQPTSPSAEVALAPAAPLAAAPAPMMKRVAAKEEATKEMQLKMDAPVETFSAEGMLVDQQAATTGAASDLDFVHQNVVADNRAIVEHEYEAAVAATQTARSERFQFVGRLLLWAGAGLMLFIAVLLIARRPLKSAVWIPAVGIAALSLALGIAWFVPEQQAGRQIARFDETAATSTQFGAVPEAAEPPAAPITLPAAINDQEGAPFRELANNTQVADAPQATPAALPTAPTDPTTAAAPVPPRDETLKQIAPGRSGVPSGTPPSASRGGGGAGGGFAGGAPPNAIPSQPAKPGMAMRARIEPQDRPGGDTDVAKKDAARKQEAEQLPANEKLAESKKASPNEAAGAPGAKPGEATDKLQADLNAAANAPRGKGTEADRTILERMAGQMESVAPDSIFWRPLSRIGNDGLLTIEFTMPAVESEYRLILDAFGNGRAGGQQQLLICREKREE